MVRPISQSGIKGFLPVHGMAQTKVHKVWAGMLDRCRPDNKKHAKNYYNRGIVICDRWHEFENFYEDMGEPPIGMSLDRVDNDSIYTKENCRWASNITQQNNRQNTRYLNINGKKIPLMKFAANIGIKKTAAQYFYSVLKAASSLGLEISVWED